MIWESLGKKDITRSERAWWWVFRHLPRKWVMQIVAGYIADCGKMMHDSLLEAECDSWIRLHMLSAMFYRAMYSLDKDPKAFEVAYKTLVSIRAVCAAAANTLAFIDPDKAYGHLGGDGEDEVH
jgi:hypothetical protein